MHICKPKQCTCEGHFIPENGLWEHGQLIGAQKVPKTCTDAHKSIFSGTESTQFMLGGKKNVSLSTKRAQNVLGCSQKYLFGHGKCPIHARRKEKCFFEHKKCTKRARNAPKERFRARKHAKTCASVKNVAA